MFYHVFFVFLNKKTLYYEKILNYTLKKTTKIIEMKKTLLSIITLMTLSTTVATETISSSMADQSQIEKKDQHIDVKFILGSSFAGHMNQQSLIGGKSGVSLSFFAPNGIGQEIEYVWNPTTDGSQNDIRHDMLLANFIILSSFHSEHIRPHLSIGLGWTQLSKINDNNDYSARYEKPEKKGSVAIQLKAGYEREIAQGLSWGLEYGYLRTIHELHEWKHFSKLPVYNFKTQFINSHISLRF